MKAVDKPPSGESIPLLCCARGKVRTLFTSTTTLHIAPFAMQLLLVSILLPSLALASNATLSHFSFLQRRSCVIMPFRPRTSMATHSAVAAASQPLASGVRTISPLARASYQNVTLRPAAPTPAPTCGDSSSGRGFGLRHPSPGRRR